MSWVRRLLGCRTGSSFSCPLAQFQTVNRRSDRPFPSFTRILEGRLAKLKQLASTQAEPLVDATIDDFIDKDVNVRFMRAFP